MRIKSHGNNEKLKKGKKEGSFGVSLLQQQSIDSYLCNAA
jgi:hypothetical protein